MCMNVGGQVRTNTHVIFVSNLCLVFQHGSLVSEVLWLVSSTHIRQWSRHPTCRGSIAVSRSCIVSLQITALSFYWCGWHNKVQTSGPFNGKVSWSSVITQAWKRNDRWLLMSSLYEKGMWTHRYLCLWCFGLGLAWFGLSTLVSVQGKLYMQQHTMMFWTIVCFKHSGNSYVKALSCFNMTMPHRAQRNFACTEPWLTPTPSLPELKRWLSARPCHLTPGSDLWVQLKPEERSCSDAHWSHTDVVYGCPHTFGHLVYISMCYFMPLEGTVVL